MSFFKFFFVIIFFLATSPCLLFAEYVFQKDGSIVIGRIESETAAALSVRVADGRLVTVNPKNVMRILYTNLYMGKIHLQKVDGSSIEGYIVDEDQITYIMRKNLYSPVEFTVRRDEVLFTTRKNPVALEGAAETDRILLKWKPPYTAVKEYNIYVRSSGSYTLAGKSGSTSFTVKGVKSNTFYFIKVTAIDRDGVETLPTNEIKVKTMNIQPEPPKRVKAERLSSKDAKSYTARLTWEAGLSVDGRIRGYKVLEKTGTRYKDVGFAPKNEFEIKNVDKSRNYFFTLRTVDEKGWESENSRIVNTLPLEADFSIEGSFILPFGKFKNVHSLGYGAMLRAIKPNIPFYNFEAGIALGYWQFKGANDVTSSFMVPALATLGYRVNVWRLVFTPRVAAGLTFNQATYNSLVNGVGPAKEKKNTSAIEQLVMAGMMINLAVTDRFSCFIGADAGSVVETRNLFPFLAMNAGVMVKF